MDKKEIDLNVPYSSLNNSVKEEEVKATVEETPKAVAVEEESKEEEGGEPSVEETKVPYSRFKNVNAAKNEAERKAEKAIQEAEKWRIRAQELESRPKNEDTTPEPDKDWIELYGDTDISKRAYQLDLRRREALIEEAKREALAAIDNERLREETRINENKRQIDSEFKTLSQFLGRDLTEKEQSSILDIVDEWTPKNKDGTYAGATLSYDKAWELLEMKNKLSKAPSQQSRDAAAAISGSKSQGEPTLDEKNKDFNPSWGAVTEAIRRRL